MNFFTILCSLTLILFIYYLYSSISFCYYLYNYENKNHASLLTSSSASSTSTNDSSDNTSNSSAFIMSTIKKQKNKQIQVKNNTINKILNIKEDNAEIKYNGKKINILNKKTLIKNAIAKKSWKRRLQRKKRRCQRKV